MALFPHIKEIPVRNFEYLDTHRLIYRAVLTLYDKAVGNDKRKVLLEESIFEAIKDGRGQVLALKNEDYFNPAFVPADPVDNPRSTRGRSPPAPTNPV